MELHAQIKKYRGALGLSQEELAEKVYVTRQTVSNWENGKSYPDIHSLLLLSNLFQLSLDQLIKGDLETMKELVNEYDLRQYKHCRRILVWYVVALAGATALLDLWRSWYAAGLWVFVFGLLLFRNWKLNQLNKKHDIQTYREINVFMEGSKLDELQKAVEAGKRPYQKGLNLLLYGGGAALGILFYRLFHR